MMATWQYFFSLLAKLQTKKKKEAGVCHPSTRLKHPGNRWVLVRWSLLAPPSPQLQHQAVA